MAKKPPITTIASGYYSRTALNTNFENLRDQFDNTLSLDGSTPNAMQADLDMNSNDILNAGEVNVNALTIDGVAVFPNTTQLATTYATQNYTGNGSTTTYAMGFNPATKANVDVYIDGVYQNQDAFNISGTNLTFTAAPPLNSAIEIKVPVNVTSLTNTDSSQIVYNQGGSNAVTTNVKAKLQEFVSVKDFGAVGDGVTDDTAAIQAAIDALPASGGQVYVPAGKYLVTSGLVTTVRVKLVGDGNSVIAASPSPSEIIKASSMTGPVYTMSAANSICESISFIGQSGNTGDGVLITSGRCTLRDVGVFSMGNDGVRIGTDTGGENNNLWVLDNCKTKSNGQHGVHISEGAGPLADANAGTCIALDTQANGGSGVYLNGAQLNSFYGGAYQQNAGYGIHLGPNAKSNMFFGGDPELNVTAQVRLDNGAEDNAFYVYTAVIGGFSISNTSSNNRIETLDFNRLVSGLKFPPVQVASSDPNTLDDYEETAFTPTAIGGTTAGTGTYTEQSGRATKIGRVVTFSINISWTAHTGTGTLEFVNLPFSGSTSGPRFIPVTINQFDGPAPGAGKERVAFFDSSLSRIQLREFDPATGTIGAPTGSAMTATGSFYFSGSYTVN